MKLPRQIKDETELEELLSRPTEAVVELFRRMPGDLVILGAGGKIGPSLAAMACRARQAAGAGQEITVVARFRDPAAREAFQRAGARAIAGDLLDGAAVEALPAAANVIYMVGMKFGATGQPALTWAVNGLIPAYVAGRYRSARIVAFSTGCVYDFVPVSSAGPSPAEGLSRRAGTGGSVESDPLTPAGEYANSCVARERIFEHFSRTCGTPMVQLRLNYAVELRYGVLVDLAQAVAAGRPIDLSMGYFNAIWQGDVNAAALRLLEEAACPPLAINLTGPEKLSVRQVATRLGELMGKPVVFRGVEAATALLSDASRASALLGRPAVPIDQVLRWTADWIARGGRTLGKPTHFQTRDGKY